MRPKPLVGISSCLLGNSVRYNGGHKMVQSLLDVLGELVEFVPICPEVECGMCIPREPMSLVDVDGELRLVTNSTNIDLTLQLERWITPKVEELAKLPLSGFVFKSKSPSCGLSKINVFRNGVADYMGQGIFAKRFIEAFPLLPVEDDARLSNPILRENFILRIFSL